jgi:stage II sporulation protein D
MDRRASILGLVLMTWVLTGVAQADQSIRVLLSPAVPRLIVAAPGGVMARLNGQDLRFSTPVTVSAADDIVLLDGTPWRTERVRLEAEGEDLSVSFSDTNGAPLRLPGTLELLARGKALQVINELDLESYVAGVVPWEMNPAWDLEALKAQSVAARTYALYQRRANAGRGYDIVAGIQDQVYRGRHTDSRVQAAVEATRSLVLMHGNAPILAAFSSTAAGPTEDAAIVWAKDLPYLKGVDCPFDVQSPHYHWRVSFRLDTLESNLRRQGMPVGTIATLAPMAYSRSGRIVSLRILHSHGQLVLRGEELRRIVGYTVIPSTLFQIESVGRDVVLVGRGAGHAVGLCQWGTKELAALGYPFSTILRYYFPGTDLVKLGSE